MKIREYQAGGAYSPYILHDAASQQPATTSKKTDKTEDKISGAIVDLLKQNGLRNDVDYTLAAANKFLADIDDPLSFGESNKYAKLIKLQSLVNRVKRNKESYDAAVKKIAEQNAGSEVALTSTGQMYVLDTEDESGTLKVITAKEYSENQDKYRALSNNELLEYREQASNLTFASSITNNLQSTIGMDTVMNYVNKLIGDFKEDTVKRNQTTHFTSKEKAQITEGLNQIITGDAPPGFYQGTMNVEKTDTGYYKAKSNAPEEVKRQQESFAAALNYLYKSLPENMKNLLKGRTAVEGGDPTKAGDVMGILSTALYENTKHVDVQDITYKHIGEGNGKSGSGKSSGSGSMENQSWGQMVHNNAGLPRNNQIVLPGGEIGFTMPTYHYDYIPSYKDKTSLPQVSNATNSITELQNWGLYDSTGKVYFGNKEINVMNEAPNVLIDNSKGMNVVYLPIDASGQINFEALELMEQVQQEISSKHITDPAKVAQIWADNGMQYDPNTKTGIPPGMKMKKYAMQYGYTTNDGVHKEALKNNTFISEMKLADIKEIQGLFNKDARNKDLGKMNLDQAGWTNGYRGVIFIPLSDNEYQVRIAGNSAYQSKQDINEIKARQDMARQAGEYDYETGTWERTLRGGTTLDSLN